MMGLSSLHFCNGQLTIPPHQGNSQTPLAFLQIERHLHLSLRRAGLAAQSTFGSGNLIAQPKLLVTRQSPARKQHSLGKRAW